MIATAVVALMLPGCGAVGETLTVATASGMPAVPVSSAGPATDFTDSGAYLAGRFAQHSDDWTAAADFLVDSLARDPGNIGLMRRASLMLVGVGRMEEAVSVSRDLIAVDPSSQLAATLLVADHMVAGRYPDAETLVRTMSKDGLGRYIAPLLRTWIDAGRADTAAALNQLRSIRDLPGFSLLHDLHAGLIAELAQDPDAAVRWYSQAVAQTVPLRVVQVVGSFYERTGRTDEALDLYRRFRDAHPDNGMVDAAIARLEQGVTASPVVADARQGMAEALFQLASSLDQEGAEEMALLYGRIALHLRPDFPLARLMVGDILASRGRDGEAVREYQRIEDDPTVGWSVRLRIAESHYRMDDAASAEAVLKAMIDERPDRVDALIRLGDLYRATERFADAITVYDEAEARLGSLERQHWTLLYARGLAYDRTSQWERAEADLSRAVDLNPEQPFLLNYLGYSWVDRGINLDRARVMIEKAVSLRPSDGFIVDSLGWALYRLGRYEEAVGHLERAVELEPLDATINDHLGDGYWSVGRYSEARFQWRRALQQAEEPALAEAIRTKLAEGLPRRQTAGATPEIR